MKRNTLFQIAGVLYVCFALVTAHTALAPIEASASPSAYAQADMEAPDGVVLDHQRLHESDSYFNVNTTVKPRTTKDAYTVVVWSGKACSACVKYKDAEVPALRKLGYRVVIKDYFKDADERPKEVKMLPTIELMYKGKPIKYEIYWKAKDIDKFIAERLSLKKTT